MLDWTQILLYKIIQCVFLEILGCDLHFLSPHICFFQFFYLVTDFKAYLLFDYYDKIKPQLG